MELRTTLTTKQKEENYCSHLIATQAALSAGAYAAEKTVLLTNLQKLLSDEQYNKLKDSTSTGTLKLWAVPDGTYVVPTFEPASYHSPTEYIHIREGKCPLPQCKEKKSKTHALVRKEVPLCIHNVLVHAATDTTTTATQPTASKVSIPKLDRDLTVGQVIGNISRRFPTLTNIEDGFVQRSRRYVEKLHSSKADINRVIKAHSVVKCLSCTDSELIEWQFKPKKAFLLSMGHLIKIEIPLKFCTSCKTVYYPGKVMRR